MPFTAAPSETRTASGAPTTLGTVFEVLTPTTRRGEGLRVPRRFTRAGLDPFDTVRWEKRASRIRDEAGNAIFELKDAEIPSSWSQVATDVIVSKYFRRAGVPQVRADGTPERNPDGTPVLGAETSAKQTLGRLARAWRWWGERYGYFASTEDAQSFEDEIRYMLVRQITSPNSPQWFNTGLALAYGITGPPQGHWYVDPDTGKLTQSEDAYTRSQAHACYIQSVKDAILGDGGIMDLVEREARIFKYGSGTGTNFSTLRAEGEPVSAGGVASGLMSWLKIYDRAAAAIKSGGTTRRAAKMVIVDIDHPDIEKFIWWKAEEEKKVAALVAAGYPSDFNGEAYLTVSGQNSNNSIRVPNAFLETVEADGDWHLRWRTDRDAVSKTLKARKLWRDIAEAAWQSADPGVQYDTTIQEWHTCPASGRINATNPCSEYVFLDETACNLASINLMKFADPETGAFDMEGYVHAIRLWTTVLEITVAMAHLPAKEMARGTYNFRTLGLGYANLGTLLMVWGVPYDSAEARTIAGALTAILTGEAYATSAELAAVLGPFPKYEENREPMLRVIRNHRRAAYDAPEEKYESLTITPMAIDQERCPKGLRTAAHRAWDRALELGERHGYRNAQVTVIAPTGCLVGGSLIATDRGLRRLQGLGKPWGPRWQDVRLRVYTDDGPQQATKFFVNGVAQTRKIRTASGYEIQGTLQHRIRIVDPRNGEFVWKYFADVRPGDVVPLATHTLLGEPRRVPLPPLGEADWAGNSEARAPRQVTSGLAELVGYFMGDGSLHAKGLRFCVTAADTDVVDHLRARIRELFNLEPHVSDQQGYTEVAVHSVPLVLWWEACGFTKHIPGAHHGGKGYLPHIPDALLATNNPAVYRAFLRGLFEADGTVTVGNPSWTTTHAPFAQDVRTLLLALGFPTSSKQDVSGWGKSAMTVLRVKNQSYNAAFLDEIGFFSHRKSQKVRLAGVTDGLAVWQARKRDYVYLAEEVFAAAVAGSGRRQAALQLARRRHGAVSRGLAEQVFAGTRDPRLGRAPQCFYDTVSTNEDGGEQFTYDLSVPENVTYAANGFLSHNTIGLQMDCDTTGVEPDFALVKFKKLAGGGYFKIVNQSVPQALKTLGYSSGQIADIVQYITGTLAFNGNGNGNGGAHAPIGREALLAKGFTDADIGRVEAQLPGAFHLTMAFAPAVLGYDLLQRLGLAEKAKVNPLLHVLEELGFASEQIEEAQEVICGHQTIEGAPHIKSEHLAVFDCANKCGPRGQRFIPYEGHVKMLAAVQPFVSGSISKTTNMPAEATVEDVERVYKMGWRLGLKANALYRDGSKLSQPLSTQASGESGAKTTGERVVEKVVEKIVERPHRVKLPRERSAITRKVDLGGHEFYLTVGLYADGKPGELFITMGKEGTFASGLADAFAKVVSIALQYGVPLENIIRQLRHMRFSPEGFTGDPDIPSASSVADFLAQWLTKTFPDGRHAEAGKLPLPEGAAEARPSARDAGSAAVAALGLETVPSGPNGGPTAMSPAPGVVVTFSQAAPIPGYGFTGDKCSDCGSLRMVQNGSCKKCLDCGTTTGCS